MLKNFQHVYSVLINEGQTLKKILRSRKIRQEDFAEDLGISRNQLIITMKEHPLSNKYRGKVLSLLNMTEDEFKRLALEQYGMTNGIEDSSGLSSGVDNSQQSNLNMWIIPAKAQAVFTKGFAERTFSSSIQKVEFPMIAGECFCFEVEGATMYPFYVPGSFVVCTIIEDWEWLRKGKTYAFQTDEELLIKTYLSTEAGHIKLSVENMSQDLSELFPTEKIRQIYAIDYKIVRD